MNTKPYQTASRIWYETWDNNERRPYWWSTRDERGKCFEIRKSGGLHKLYKGERETYLSSHSTLQDAMDAAENF